MQSIDLTAKVKNLIRFGLPLLILISAVIGYAEFKYWHSNETIRLDDAKVTGTMVSVRVLTKGKVKELLFDDGAQVQAGDVIARLEVSITDEEIRQLENTVQLAKDRYAELQAGQTVRVAVQRERVITPPPTYSSAPSGDLAKLQERANRMEELFNMGAVSAVQRDAARRAYESALSESSTPQYSEPTVEYYTEYVDEFRPTPPEVLAGAQQAIQQAELSLNVARQEARETEVTAPVSGTIYYGVEAEKDLEAGDSVAKIGDNRELWIEAVVTEDVFDKISLGKLAEVTIGGQKVFGTVVEKIKPNVTKVPDEDADATEPVELPEIPDATNQPAPLIGDTQSQPPAENSSTPETQQPSTNEAQQPAQAPLKVVSGRWSVVSEKSSSSPAQAPTDENSTSAENPSPTAENSSPPPTETPTPENQSTTKENSSPTENPAPSNETQSPPKMPEIPVGETQEKPNDKFIIKISLPVDRDFDCKPGTVVDVEIKI